MYFGHKICFNFSKSTWMILLTDIDFTSIFSVMDSNVFTELTSLREFNLASLMYWQYIYIHVQLSNIICLSTEALMVYSVKQKLISCKPFLLIKFHCFSFAVIEMTMQKTSLQNSILTDSIRSHFKTHLNRNKTILISHCQNFLNRTLQKI